MDEQEKAFVVAAIETKCKSDKKEKQRKGKTKYQRERGKGEQEKEKLIKCVRIPPSCIDLRASRIMDQLCRG